MKCSNEIVSLMHKYLDEEINEEEKKTLQHHLSICDNCAKHMTELKKSVAFIQSTSHIVAPPNFTELVMKQLPQQKSTISWRRWMKNHPILVAASIFVLLMSASMFSYLLDSNNDLSVSGQANLIIDKERNVVVVPEGEIVEGDLLIKNGSVQVDGQVNGSITVINGEKYMASAGTVAGEIYEIDQGLEWVWYNIKNFISDVVNIFNNENKE